MANTCRSACTTTKPAPARATTAAPTHAAGKNKNARLRADGLGALPQLTQVLQSQTRDKLPSKDPW
eukprot:4437313-Amphidinium_carterae.1